MRDKKDKPWKAEYREKLVSADEAVSHIRSGQRIVFSHAAGESLVLSDALVRNRALFENVEIVHMVAMGEAKYCEPGMEKHFRHNSFFLGASTRKAAKEGRADVTPVYFSEVPELFRTTLPVDAVFLNLSPPDEHGYCSFGISVDYSKPAAMEAELVIAQINPSMPRTLGDSFIHISDIDYIVEADTPLIELPPAGISEVERAIGKNCASLIEDGDTLQLGIGAIPDAVLGFLKEKKDLGIHSEMISDGIVELYEGGVITNRRKSLHAGKSIVTFLMGTRRLFLFYRLLFAVKQRCAAVRHIQCQYFADIQYRSPSQCKDPVIIILRRLLFYLVDHLVGWLSVSEFLLKNIISVHTQRFQKRLIQIPVCHHQITVADLKFFLKLFYSVKIKYRGHQSQ